MLHCTLWSFTSSTATCPDANDTAAFVSFCSDAMDETGPWSVLIECSGAALLTFHTRTTPWRSLAVTNVPGMPSMNFAAVKPFCCF